MTDRNLDEALVDFVQRLEILLENSNGTLKIRDLMIAVATEYNVSAVDLSTAFRDKLCIASVKKP